MGNGDRKSEEEGNTSRDAQTKERIDQECLNRPRNIKCMKLIGKSINKCFKIIDVRGNDADEFGKNCISMCISLLDNRENRYEGSKNESILKDHVQSMKKGIEFLGKLYTFSTTRNLARSIRQLAADVKQHSHIVHGEENEDLRRIMMTLINIFKNYDECSKIFKKVDLTRHYRSIIDLLLENISEVKSIWYNNGNATSHDQAAGLDGKVGELRLALTYFKPLCIWLAHSSHLVQMETSLDSVINDAAVVIFLLFVDKMDKETVVHRLNMIMRNVKEMGPSIYKRYLKFRSVKLNSALEGWWNILDNLIHILATNSASLNEPSQHLFEELKDLRTFLGEREMLKKEKKKREMIKKEKNKREMLNHYCGITESAESICYQAVPIVSTIYVEEDLLKELDHMVVSVVDQIKMFKLHGSQEIRLCDFPRVDGLGFLEFFLERLDELHGQNKMSVTTAEIKALWMDFHCLVSSTKTFEEKHIVQLAYQAEYVIDLYLAIPDPRCISTLSRIVEEVKEIKEKVLALPDTKSLHVEDVDLPTSKPVHGTPSHVNNELVGFQEEINAMKNDLLTSHVNNELVGFQEEIVAMKNDLLTGESDLQVISLVGMAGAGKTSLANHLFKEFSDDGHFDKKAWCTVSQTYQMKDSLLTILKQINPSNITDIDHQELADNLYRSLRRQRYLVVMDDVWDVSFWKHLSRYFPNDRNKSRVLITTRDHNVASGTMSNIHKLQPLTEDESWELLQKKLGRQESLPYGIESIAKEVAKSCKGLPDGIESIAKEVAKSCKGLPLSISIIGGLLHHADRNEEMWNQIAKDVSSAILSDPRGECKAILELSYNHLPDRLKPCFLYLGLFPEDHEISVARLVRLWVAEGFVRGRIESDVCVEDVGRRYVDDLMKRSLIIPIKEKTEGGVKSVRLHDLLRDFCLEKVKDEHFFTVLHDKGIFDLSLCHRRISINGDMYEDLPSLSWNSVRTIISFDLSLCPPLISINGDSAIDRILRSKHMLLLNVLDMPDLDESASYLHHYVHLRYLALWNLRSIKRFFRESSICTLLNLEVLILYCRYSILKDVLPDFIWDLVKLRHIDIRDNISFPHDSKKIEDSTVLLENLKSLSKAKLHYGDTNWLRKLPKLQKLRCIIFPSFDNSLQQYRLPELDLCNRLTSLNVECGINSSETRRCELQLPANLRKLSLSRFYLNEDNLSGIGKSLPNLEVLKLLHNSFGKWSVDDEDFPNLKVLKISEFASDFSRWDASEESFPRLEQLWLQSCYMLKEIPLCFGDNLNLRLISIENCNRSLDESAREIQKIQAEAQNLELKVHISYRWNKNQSKHISTGGASQVN